MLDSPFAGGRRDAPVTRRRRPGSCRRRAGHKIVVSYECTRDHVVDSSNGVIDVTASSPLGRYRKQIGVEDIRAVRVLTGGPDNDRLLVELMGPDGDPRLGLPGRLTTLSARDQLEVARVLSDRLRVPLRATLAL